MTERQEAAPGVAGGRVWGATPVVFAVRSAREVNFVRFAMLKNIVGFVIIRQNALIPTPDAPTPRGGGGEREKTSGFFFSNCLEKKN